ncbi:ATP-binding protein [Nocardiopsis sp. NPDC055551]
MGRWWPRGLRSRLLAGFALVTVLGSLAATWAITESAGEALVASNQRRISETVSAQIGAVAHEVSHPPDQAALDRLRDSVGTDTLVVFEDLRSVDGTETDLITDGLREAVREGDRVVTQRVVDADRPWLLVGAPVMITAPDGERTPSGIEVYAVRDLSAVQEEVDALVRAAAVAGAAVLLLAALLALFTARGVLRPVRELRDTARRLSAGDLDARTEPQGVDELAELTVTINEMAESVQGSMATMERMRADARRFAADVSHELRTPLSTLTAVTEVLAASTEDMAEDARESARMAISETRRLVRLVEDLMEVSRFDAGSAHLREEEVDMVSAVRDTLRARDRLDQVELHAPEELPVRVDRRRLDVIVANLVGNALRHGEPPVRVGVFADRTHVNLVVTDGGPGLAEHVVPHVFDRFFKADAARTRTPGSGLGLAIALENARLHDGDLTAGNGDDGGARFVLRLPRAPGDIDPGRERGVRG